MNPPKILLKPPPIFLFPDTEGRPSFFPELQRGLINFPKGSTYFFNPSPSPFFLGNFNNPLTHPLLVPKLFLAPPDPPGGSPTGSASPAPTGTSGTSGVTPAAAPGMTTDEKWKLIMNIFSLIESMDAKGQRMTVNGGIGGCRYTEFSHITKEKEDEKVGCVVQFQTDSHADVNLQVRKIKDRNESRITGFRLSYEKEVVKDVWPSNQVAVKGFRFSPPPGENVPFYKEVSPPTFGGFQLKYIPTQNGLLEIPLLGYPLYKIFAEDAPELEFTHDYLDSWGLDDPAFYKVSHTQDHRIPQGVMDFLELIRHGDVSPPSWINLNKKHGKPSLFDWLSFEKIDITAHLREGTLTLPNFGSINFSRNKRLKLLREMFDKLQALSSCESDYKELHQKYIKAWDETARLEVRGTTKKLEGVLSNLEIPWADFTVGNLKFSLRGVTVDKVGADLPALKTLIDRMNKGTFSLDNLKVHLEGLKAEKITLTDLKTGTEVTIAKGNLGSVDLKGASQIDLTSLKADKLTLKHGASGLTLVVQKPDISFLSFGQDKDLSRLLGNGIKGDGLDLSYLGTTLHTGKSEITKFSLSHSATETQIEIGELKSSGSIEYQIPGGNFSFKTSGASKLSKLKFIRKINDVGETELSASVGLAGTIKTLEITQDAQFAVKFSDTVFKDGEFALTARLSDDPEAPLKGLNYSLNTKITKATVDSGQMGPITLAPSKLTDGKVIIRQDNWDPHTLPQFDIAGTLNFHINEFAGKNESFNLPGLDVSGSIRAIDIEGPARFHSTPTGFILEKPEELTASGAGTPPPPLKVKARLEAVTVIQDPHLIKGTELSTWPGNKVVKTNMKIDKADLKIDDVELIEFSKSDEAKKRNTALQRISLKGIAIENIEAGGVAWAKFPIFYYLRGLFPKIGSVATGPDMSTSFFRLAGFKIESVDSNPVISFEGFNSELYEVGGRDQFAKISIPLIKISPNAAKMVETGPDPITLDVMLTDKARGGFFHFKSVPRPLEERNSRLVPLDAATK